MTLYAPKEEIKKLPYPQSEETFGTFIAGYSVALIFIILMAIFFFNL